MNTEQRQRRRVTRAIKLALARIAEKDPELSRLLKETIETGTYLSYTAVAPQAAPRRTRTSRGKKTSPPQRENPIRD